MARVPFVQHLSTNGDGTGDVQVTGDYSSAAETFEYEVPAGERHTISRMIIYIQDTGTFDTGDYGNGITLTNGWTLTVRNAADDLLANLTPTPVRTSGNIAGYCYDLTNASWGLGDEFVVARWTFTKFTSGGEGIVLDQGERLVLTVNDAYDDLTGHLFTVQGFTGEFY